jgi:hypothetical protein
MKNYLIRKDMKECGHVVKQFIQSGLMNSEEVKLNVQQKTHTIYEHLNIKSWLDLDTIHKQKDW